MAAGIKALRKIQLGKETTPGGGATATARLIGTLGMEMERKYYRPEDLETGKLSSFERSIIVGQQAKLPFDSDANYEQLGYLLGMGIIGGITPTGLGPYVRTYLPNLIAANAPDTYAVEYGDDIQAFKSLFCFAKSLELTGTLDDALKVKADIVGQPMATASFTSGLLNPTSLNPVVVGTGKLYIDATWAALGGSWKSSTLVDVDLKLSEGVIPVKYLDGLLYFTDRAEKKRHLELDVTFAFNAISTALWTPFMASPQTLSFVRLEFTGPAISGGNDKLTIDGSFIVDSFSTLQEREGQDIVKLKLISQYDPTSTKEWQVVLTNGLSTLP